MGQVVADNEIGFNNYAGYDPEWEAGGAKWVRSKRLVVRSNHVHDNRGPGLWTDGSSEAVLYEQNVVERNSGAGILHEISYAASLRGNVVSRNGFGSHGWLDGAGIVLSASSSVEVYGNTVVDNRNGIGIVQTNRGRSDPRLPPHETADVYVHDNSIRMRVGHTGLVQNVGDTAYYTSRNNRFAGNRYVLGCNPTYFTWQDSTGARAYRDLSARQWVAAGNDTSGSFTKNCEP
jgi:parallel beta-helix repeat protein